ncbi:hypothetical protein HanPSC8_Chr16g0717501 [Helianthus annuus]|nr:hypothetical protein HanPSC8_Chr16g0717501 [Helianthus annuus]
MFGEFDHFRKHIVIFFTVCRILIFVNRRFSGFLLEQFGQLLDLFQRFDFACFKLRDFLIETLQFIFFIH